MAVPVVGFDARMWGHPGIGRYIRELLFELCRKPGFRMRLIGAPEGGVSWAPERRAAKSRIYSLAEQWEVPRAARGVDLLHVPHFNVPAAYRGKMVVTVHDLTYLHDPAAARSPLGAFYTRFLLSRIAQRAAAVITVSEATKQDLLAHVRGMRPERVHVVYEAASPVFARTPAPESLQAARSQYELDKPFVLFVGSLKPHKNLPALVEAMGRARRRGVPHELVVVGRRDPRQPALAELVERTSFVRYLGEVSDESLSCVYRLADLFCMPSLREGFGLPLVEAMTCGAPCIASDRSSLPEVLGDAGELFDPSQIDALSDLLYNILQNRELRQKMRVRGFSRAAEFSWEAAAESTARIYGQVLA